MDRIKNFLYDIQKEVDKIPSEVKNDEVYTNMFIALYKYSFVFLLIYIVFRSIESSTGEEGGFTYMIAIVIGIMIYYLILLPIHEICLENVVSYNSRYYHQIPSM